MPWGNAFSPPAWGWSGTDATDELVCLFSPPAWGWSACSRAAIASDESFPHPRGDGPAAALESSAEFCFPHPRGDGPSRGPAARSKYRFPHPFLRAGRCCRLVRSLPYASFAKSGSIPIECRSEPPVRLSSAKAFIEGAILLCKRRPYKNRKLERIVRTRNRAHYGDWPRGKIHAYGASHCYTTSTMIDRFAPTLPRNQRRTISWNGHRKATKIWIMSRDSLSVILN